MKLIAGAQCAKRTRRMNETNARNEWTEWANRNTERNTWTTANRNYRTSYMKLHEGAKPYEGIKPHERTKWTNLTKWTHLTNPFSLSPRQLTCKHHFTAQSPSLYNRILWSWISIFSSSSTPASEWHADLQQPASLLWPTRDDPLFLLKFVVQVPGWSTAHLNSTRYPLDYLSLNHHW